MGERADLAAKGYAERLRGTISYGDSGIVSIEACPQCKWHVARMEVWDLERERPLGENLVASMPDIEVVVELAPCGHDAPKNDDGTRYWLNRVNSGVALTWQRKDEPDDEPWAWGVWDPEENEGRGRFSLCVGGREDAESLAAVGYVAGHHKARVAILRRP